MTLNLNSGIIAAIGNTPLIRVNSLSNLTGNNIYLKCEHLNPGGSIKDRAALSMILKAKEKGLLKPGQTIVEGTAGNTGIGLALVGRALGHPVLVVMPKGQSKEKEQMIPLFGAELKLVDPCPFANENHFYHTARRLGEENKNHWWANQFENTDNHLAHYEHTGPEIYSQLNGKVDVLVAAAGTGGTIAGTSKFLKEKNSKTKIVLVDPDGSGLVSFVKTGEFKSSGSSITEGIGIMRLVENFKQALVDDAINIHDDALVTLAHYVREQDGILLGISSALNLAAAFREALLTSGGKNIVTFFCDSGERAISKLYNHDFLISKELDPKKFNINELSEMLK